MKEYLYWGQIQERLSRRVLSGEEPYSFYDAVRELWEEGKAHQAEQLPAVTFSDWNVMDYGQFDQIYGKTPVDMKKFYSGFQRNQSAAKVSEPVHETNVYLLRIACDQALGIHHHEYFEIDYVMRGGASLKLEGNSHSLRVGDFCFLSPGLRHDIVPNRGAQVISITIPGVTVEQTLYRLLRRDNILTDFFHSALDSDKTGWLLISVPEERRIREIIRGLLHEHFCGEEFAADIMPDHLAILFAFILRRCGDRYERHNGETDRLGTPPMLAILKYIRTHYKTISLNELSEVFHYEPSYLGKQIKAVTGKNYTDLIREVRIAEAKRLLRSTDLSVDAVAEEIGYTGRVHFFRSFRDAVGMTPGEYRKQKREQ